MKLILQLFCFLSLGIASAQEFNPNLNEFVEETQSATSEDGRFTMIWWVPTEFWELSFENDKSMTEEQKDEFIELLSPYTIVAAMDGQIGTFGTVDYVEKEKIAKSLTFIGNDGYKQKCIDEDDLIPEVQMLLTIFKPLLGNMLGQFGENMNFYVFSDESIAGGRTADPLKSGIVKVAFMDSEVEWRTPLASLIPRKVCAEDQEEFNGQYKYCPFHGTELDGQ